MVLGSFIFRYMSQDSFKLFFKPLSAPSNTEPLDARGVAASIQILQNNYKLEQNIGIKFKCVFQFQLKLRLLMILLRNFFQYDFETALYRLD